VGLTNLNDKATTTTTTTTTTATIIVVVVVKCRHRENGLLAGKKDYSKNVSLCEDTPSPHRLQKRFLLSMHEPQKLFVRTTDRADLDWYTRS